MNKDLTPKAIVAALDTHIIGQKDAKRAVAVALPSSALSRVTSR